jgi:hypothetical protein
MEESARRISAPGARIWGWPPAPSSTRPARRCPRSSMLAGEIMGARRGRLLHLRRREQHAEEGHLELGPPSPRSRPLRRQLEAGAEEWGCGRHRHHRRRRQLELLRCRLASCRGGRRCALVAGGGSVARPAMGAAASLHARRWPRLLRRRTRWVQGGKGRERGWGWGVYLSISSPARAKPVHEPYWTGVGRDLEACEFFLARARPEMWFLVVSHYKMRGRPAQARPRLEPGPKIKARAV